jgi:hypothetical protein
MEPPAATGDLAGLGRDSQRRFDTRAGGPPQCDRAAARPSVGARGRARHGPARRRSPRRRPTAPGPAQRAASAVGPPARPKMTPRATGVTSAARPPAASPRGRVGSAALSPWQRRRSSETVRSTRRGRAGARSASSAPVTPQRADAPVPGAAVRDRPHRDAPIPGAEQAPEGPRQRQGRHSAPTIRPRRSSGILSRATGGHPAGQSGRAKGFVSAGDATARRRSGSLPAPFRASYR